MIQEVNKSTKGTLLSCYGIRQHQPSSPQSLRDRLKMLASTSTTIQGELLSIMAQTIVDSVGGEVKEAGSFSILVDEVTDVQRAALHMHRLCR